MLLGGLTLGGKLNGWNIINKSATSLPQELATGVTNLFYTDSVTYEPIWYVATQLVNGTNHMLICEEKRDKEEKKIVAVNVNIPIGDHGDNATIVEVIIDKDLVEGVPAGLKLKEKFQKVTKELTGISYVPVLYMGQQVVKGINYCVVAQAKVQYTESEAYAVLIKFNEFQGNTALIGIEPLE